MSKRDFWNERYADKELVWSAGPNVQFAKEVAGLKPGRALDVACGEGRNAIWLAEQGWQVTGIDFSDIGIEKADQIAEKRGQSIEWVDDDIVHYPYPAYHYDLVAILYVHTSREQRAAWLPAVISSIAVGGTFLYIGHDPDNIKKGVGGPQDSTLLPDKDEVVSHLSGFDVQSAEISHRPVKQDTGHGSGEGIALDTFVRAVRQPA